MKIFLGFSLLMVLMCAVKAQDSTSTILRDKLEEVFEEMDSEDSKSAQQLIQFLQELANNPIDINTAEITTLIQIPGITLITARSIIEYRNEKRFDSIEEIRKVSGVGKVTFQKIAPYITVKGARSRKKIYLDKEHWFNNSKIEVISRFQQTLEKQLGYSKADSLGGYVGNPLKYYQRFKLHSDHVSFNLTQEKDAGETLSGPTKFDFNSMHIGLMDNGYLKKLVIGDYSLSFGQGLVIWSGGAFGKGRDVINSTVRNERGLRPYASAQETDFFRGAAATFGRSNELTLFYSKLPQSASVVGQDSTRYPSSSGFHRTLNEMGRRDNIDQTTYGGRCRWNTNIGLFGISGVKSTFNSTIIRGNSISNQNDFQGSSNTVVGIDYQAFIRKSLLFGEYARSHTKAYAGLIGIKTEVGTSTDLSILLRSYGSEYISILGNGFGELSGNPQNERGYYIGLKHRISSYTISAYFDQYYFNAPNAGIPSPSSGFDMLGMIEAKFSSKLQGYVMIRNETKDEFFDITSESGRQKGVLRKRTRSNYRLQIQHQPYKKIRTRSRVEWVRFYSDENDVETGWLVFQDLRVVLSPKMLLDTRFTLFDTDSFNARVYQFENDLRYVLTNVALNDKGQRWYVLVKYGMSDTLEMSLKISRSVIEDAQILSSGLSEIKGDKKTFVGFQIRWWSR